MAGSLTLSTSPINFDAAGIGKVYVSGVASGLGLFQSDPVGAVFSPNGKFVGHDINNNVDLSNGFAIVQKIDGLFQFYAQAGAYSIPALGVNYHATQRDGIDENHYFGYFPLGYAKLVPTDNFSVEAGKLPSVIGDENTFTYQNVNIERGLLWNLEPAITHGGQANLTTGPIAWAVSFTDGFYSTRYNWLSGSAAWTIDPSNTLTVSGGGSVSNSNSNSIAAPYQLDNGAVINLIYTYNAAPFTISPYFQYTHNDHSAIYTPGFTKDADTYGGAVLANYNIDDNWNLGGRFEYVGSSGSATDGTVNVLFGPGSSAYSFTVTPTWQSGIYFARLEGSYVGTSSTTHGFVFGKTGNSTSQGRFLVEAGVLF